MSKRRWASGYEVHEYERGESYTEHLIVVYSEGVWRCMYTFHDEMFSKASSHESLMFKAVEREIGKLSMAAA